MELVVKRSNGRLLCRRCLLADNPFTRARGLLGRRSLADDEGLFLGTSAIHTWFMRFPIDVVFLDEDSNVVGIANSVRPWRFAIRRGSKGVLELPAGSAARHGLEIGERLTLVPQRAPDSADADRRTIQIVSSDGRFRRVASFLLARDGFDVRTLADSAELVLADGEVVILDASESLTAAARTVRSIAATAPMARVVVVSERASPGGEAAGHQSLQVFPKWDAFDEISVLLREPPNGHRTDAVAY